MSSTIASFKYQSSDANAKKADAGVKKISSYFSKSKVESSSDVPHKMEPQEPVDADRYGTLSDEQRCVFDAYMDGKNVFMTGPGGCGKSYLIKSIADDAMSRGKNIAVTAMTGCAAVLLQCNATTIHSWGGLGLASGDVWTVAKRVCDNKYKRKPWKSVDILVIDEVSMMSKKMFDVLDTIGQTTRKCYDKPFGGIQVIFSGDFYQLPPVGGSNADTLKDDSSFCFESENWRTVFDACITLRTVFRQKDQLYRNVLNDIRRGNITQESIDALDARVNMSDEDRAESMKKFNSVTPVQILPLRTLVERVNAKGLEKIAGDAKEYKYVIERKAPAAGKSRKPVTQKQMEFALSTLLQQGRFERILKLKVGCQVMCTMNIDFEREICNGTTGIVKELKDEHVTVELTNGMMYTFGIKEWESDIVEGLIVKQVPLVLAYAITIHKSQGATLECAEIDVGKNVFACGQTYVALSRVKSLDGLFLKDFDVRRVRVEPKVVEYYHSIE